MPLLRGTVTPLVGVWIEIRYTEMRADWNLVTPLVGVWIEISYSSSFPNLLLSHSPCGSVD